MHADSLGFPDCLLVTRRGRVGVQRTQEFRHAEIAQRRAEHDRRHVARAERIGIKRRQKAARHLDAFGHLCEHIRVQVRLEARRIAGNLRGRTDTRRLARAALKLQKNVAFEVQHAGEALAAGTGPVERRSLELQLVLDLVQQRDRLQRFPVHLVDERDDRDVAHPADFEQLQRLRLDALGGIEHHDCAVGCRQCTVGVF